MFLDALFEIFINVSFVKHLWEAASVITIGYLLFVLIKKLFFKLKAVAFYLWTVSVFQQYHLYFVVGVHARNYLKN